MAQPGKKAKGSKGLGSQVGAVTALAITRASALGRRPAEDDRTNPSTGRPYWDEKAKRQPTLAGLAATGPTGLGRAAGAVRVAVHKTTGMPGTEAHPYGPMNVHPAQNAQTAARQQALHKLAGPQTMHKIKRTP